MRPIPDKLKNELSKDNYYKQCCLTGRTNEKIDFHHNLIYAGRQVNKRFCILPLSRSVHERIQRYKELCDWIMWNRATNEEIEEFSKAINVRYKLGYLNEKYGKYRETNTKSHSRVFELAKNISLQK